MPDDDQGNLISPSRFIDPQDIFRFAQLHVIAVLQLLWASPEASDSVKPYLDPEIYRWGCIWLDRYSTPASQLTQPVSRDWYRGDAVRGAKRRARGDTARAARGNALRLHALAAHALNQLDQIGSFAPGKCADVILINRDVLTVPVAELNGAKVVWTMFGARLSQDERRENSPATSPGRSRHVADLSVRVISTSRLFAARRVRQR